MADIVLSDGREVTFDLTKISLREYRALFDPTQKQSDEDVILARLSGMDVDEYLDLPYPDWRKLVMAFFTVARQPLSSPNSVSESTST